MDPMIVVWLCLFINVVAIVIVAADNKRWDA
jgi:hypothetical protein